MYFVPLLAYAWNPLVGLPLALVGLVIWLVLWWRSRSAADLYDADEDSEDERREPIFGQEEVDLEPEDAFEFDTKDRPILHEDDDDEGLHGELARLSATLAGARQSQKTSDWQLEPSPAAATPAPSSSAQAIIEALRSPPEVDADSKDSEALLAGAGIADVAAADIDEAESTAPVVSDPTSSAATEQATPVTEEETVAAVSVVVEEPSNPPWERPAVQSKPVAIEPTAVSQPPPTIAVAEVVAPPATPSPSLEEAVESLPVFIPEPMAAPAAEPRRDVGRRPAQLPVERIVSLYVIAKQKAGFHGPDLIVAAEKAGLEFGDMNIYHYLLEGRRELGPVFSVANMLKPGSFELSRAEAIRTSGLSFFMTLPAALSAVAAWDLMLPVAERLAELLDGQILDEERNTLGGQGIAHIRDELAAWDRAHQDSED